MGVPKIIKMLRQIEESLIWSMQKALMKKNPRKYGMDLYGSSWQNWAKEDVIPNKTVLVG